LIKGFEQINSMPVAAGAQLLDNLLTNRWTPEQLFKFLSSEHPEVLHKLADICPECYENPLVHTGQEVVCSHCGVVAEEILDPKSYLPFDTTYALTANVAHGSSLGGTLPQGFLQQMITERPLDLGEVGLKKEDVEFIRRVLERANKGDPISTEDAQDVIKRYLRRIELTHVKTHLRHVEAQQSMRLKTELTGLLDKFGFYTYRTYNELNHQLADQAGALAERIGRFLEAGWTRPMGSYRTLAGAILVWLIEETPHLKSVAEEIKAGEGIKNIDIVAVSCMAKCPLLSSTI